jgi:hypothetical protein
LARRQDPLRPDGVCSRDAGRRDGDEGAADRPAGESIAYLDRIGEAASDKLAITKKDSDGKTIFDKTHWNWAGSYVFGRMVAVDLGRAVPALRRYVSPMLRRAASRGCEGDEVIEGRAGDDRAGGRLHYRAGGWLGAGLLRGVDEERDLHSTTR